MCKSEPQIAQALTLMLDARIGYVLTPDVAFAVPSQCLHNDLRSVAMRLCSSPGLRPAVFLISILEPRSNFEFATQRIAEGSERSTRID